MAATVCCLLNLKGGVGKTSTCYHAGGVLARGGRRVLLVDVDPQASLTQGFLGPQMTRDLPPCSTIAGLFDPDQATLPEAIVRNTGFRGLDLLPGSRHLTRVNMTPVEEWGFLQGALRDALDEVSGGYDVVLVDCPPNLHLCSWAAMAAASHVVVPLQAEDFGSQGLAPVQEAIETVRSDVNPRLELAGYLLTMFDKRLTVHASYEAMLRELYRHAVFQNVIPRAKDFVEAVAARQPVSEYKPKGAATKSVQAVVDELLKRCTEGAARRVA
jgi:chromosome partitioning protein